MNYKRNIAVGIFILSMGVLGIKSVNAQAQPAPQISSFTIAQITEASSPLYGNWKLTYSVDGIVYESILVMQGYVGAMRTRYFHPQRRRTVAIDQTMQLKSSSRGLIILGYNPVYAGTRTRADYNADNFLFQLRPDGNLLVFTCDNALQCSSVDIEAI